MDGKNIYFTSGKFEQVHDVWVLDLETGNQQQLTQGQRYHFDLSAATDGRLLFSSNREGNYDIWLRHPDVKGKLQRLTTDEALDANPAWSPGERGIVFESTRSGHPQIYAMELGQNIEPRQLTKALQGARFPRWFKGALP